MTSLWHRTAAVALVVATGSAGMAPAEAVAPADTRATTVTGACSGGPGALSLRVLPPVAGENIEVEVTARRLEAGSRWVIHVDQESGSGPHKEFRRVAIDGRWTVTTQFRASAPSDDELLLAASAYQRGARRHSCYALTSPASPEGGLTTCDNPERFAVLVAREQDDGSVLVRSLLYGVRPNSRWTFTLAAMGAGSRQEVQFDARANSRRVIRSRVVTQGVINPRLWLVMRSEHGGRCLIGVNPANVTAGEPARLRDIVRAGRRLS